MKRRRSLRIHLRYLLMLVAVAERGGGADDARSTCLSSRET